MRKNHVRAKLKRGEVSLGTWLSLPDPVAARLMARVGFDWLTVDLEHTPTNFETAALSFAATASEGPAPLARVPWNTGENIKRVLDNGAWGIIVPMVNSAAEARAAVEAARYAPKGMRSVGGQLHAISFNTDPGTYYQAANEEILVVVMAEHVIGIEALEEIAKVPGIDAMFIGPNDLLASMNQKPGFDSADPRFNDALKKVVSVAKKNGIAPGIHVADAAMAKKRIEEGFQFIAVASEVGMMLAKAQETAKTLGLGAGAAVAKY
ncbi:MAG TPA: aldolase/citrate lyase family protein [Planctomycetota bacterium]|nr:aldolase/citrate lyase family protein [Planctomycetota bacterium]